MSAVTDVTNIRVTDAIATTELDSPAVWDVRWVAVTGEEVITDAYKPGPVGPQGPQGPAGPPGIIRVNHGADATTPRPTTANIVLWVGSVEPDNWDTTKDLIAWT